MFERVWELKKTIWKWIKTDDNDWFKNLYVQDSKWKKVINIFSCFWFFSILTTLINTTLQVSVHVVFWLFSWLFDEIKKIEKNLSKKKEKKKTELLKILNEVKKKLMIYYEKISDIYNCFFNLIIILNSLIRKILYQIINLLLLLLFITDILFIVFYRIQAEITDMINI